MANAPAGSGAAGFTQGLLGALQPWLNGGAPSALNSALSGFGGTNGLLSVMLADGPGSPGAENAARMLQATQDDALKRAAARQQLGQQQIGLTESAMMLPFMQRYYGTMDGQSAAPAQTPAGASSPASPAAASATVPRTQPVPNPQTPGTTPVIASIGAPGSTARAPVPTAPNPFAIPTRQDISSIPVGGVPAGFYFGNAIMRGKSPLTAMTGLYNQQLKLEQQKYGPILAELDTLDKAQSPTQYVKASPTLMAEWRQIAPTLGYDPARGFTDPNVRTAFAFLRNRIAGALSEPTVAPPVQVSQFGGPLNSLLQRNPVTNAVTQVRSEEPLKAIVDPNGNVRYVGQSQATGQTPYETELYAPPQAVQNTAQMIANYEMPPLNGYALRTPIGAEIMGAVKKLNPSYDATQYATKNDARIKFAVGKQGDTVRSLSVATSHLNMLSDAAHALAQHDTPVLNRLANGIGVHLTGATPQTNFDAMREIVGDEVVKAIVGTGGAEGDREAIKAAFDAARSPAQIEGVISKYEALMGGQLRGLRRQYEKATGLHDFNTFVSTMAKQQLNSAANSALGNQPPKPLNVGQSTKLGQFKVTRIR